jgi:type I restriction enzyme, S subunit
MNIYPTKKLGEVCNEVRKVKPSEIYDDYFPYIDISAVDSETKTVNPLMLNVGGAPGRARQLVHEGDTIFATTRPYLENIAFINKKYDGAIASTGFCVISPNREVCDPKYIFLFVSSKEFIERVLVHQKGATYPAVSDQDILNLEIPLPPLTEQKKIVAKLEKLLAKVHKAKKLRAEAQEATSQLLPAELHKIFEEGKKKGWEEKNIGDSSIMKITSGGTPSKSHPEYYGGEIKWLKSGELNDDVNITDSEDYITEEAIKKSSAKIFPKDTVLLAMYGATAGKLGILGVEASTNQAVAGMICKKDILNYKYLYYVLGNIRNHIIAKAWGGAQPNLSQTIIKNFTIPLPSFAEQKKIVARLDSISEKTKQLQEFQKTTSDDLLALEQSILSKAFSGELV